MFLNALFSQADCPRFLREMKQMTIFQIVDDWKLPKDSATKALLDLKVNLFINTPRIFDIYLHLMVENT